MSSSGGSVSGGSHGALATSGRGSVTYQRPAGGFASVDAGVVDHETIYAGTMVNAYSTTRDLALDLQTQLPAFVKKAQARVTHLVGIIQDLRRQLHDAQQEVIKANTRLHEVLHSQIILDPDLWEKGQELAMRGNGDPDPADNSGTGSADRQSVGSAASDAGDPKKSVSGDD